MKPILLDIDDRLVGRESQMAQLSSAFASGKRVVVLAGSFGVGKTRLAAEFASRWKPGLIIGCVLTDVRDADQLDVALAQAAEAKVAGEFDRGALLRWMQRAGDALVVLDAAEGATEAVDELLDEAQRHAPGLRWLVTSRVAWNAASDDRATVRLEPLGPDDAVTLLTERLPHGAQVQDEAGTPSPMAREVVDKLDRLPLAIELAAARCRVLSLEQLSERLDQKRLNMLQAPAADRGESSSVRQALMLSYEMLDETCRSSLCRWSVFRSGFTLEAASAVAAFNGEVGELSSLEVLEELVAHSLLYRVPTIEGAPRFSMLDSVRDFAREVIEPAQLEEAKRLHARYFEAMARSVVDERGRVEPDAVLHLLVETDNFQALFEHALQAGDSEATFYSLRALYHIISRTQGPTRRLSSLFERADESAIFEGQSHQSAVLFDERGRLALTTNQIDLAAQFFADASAAAAEAGLDEVRARAERGLGYCHILREQLESAERHFSSALEYARRSDSRIEQAFIHCGLCNLNWYRRRFDDALEHAEIALEYIEAEVEPPVDKLAGVHNTLGTTLGMLGMWTRAGFHLDRAVEFYRASHDRVSEVTALSNRAVLYIYSDRCEEARSEINAVIELSQAFQQDHLTARSHLNLAGVELEAGNQEAVAAHIEACRKLVDRPDFARAAATLEMLDCVEVTYLALYGEINEARRCFARLEAHLDDGTEQLASLLVLTQANMDVAAYLHTLDDQLDGPQLAEIDEVLQQTERLLEEHINADEPPGFDWVLRRVLASRMQQLERERAAEADDDRPVLRVGPDARLVQWDGELVDLSRRGPMRRILAFLVEVDESSTEAAPVDVHRLLEAGWPDEQIEFKAGLNRVYTTLRRLRDLGLRDVVLTVDAGYCIDRKIRVERVEAFEHE